MVDAADIRHTWTSFTRKFFGNSADNKPGTEASAGSSTPEAPETEPVFSDEIQARIQDLIKDNDLLSNGKVSFVNLSTIREKLGDKWPRYRATVSQLAKTVIEKRTTPQDVHYTVGDDVYVFVFAKLNKQEALIKCALIAKEIGEQLFGDEWTSDKFSTSVAVSETDGSVSLQEGSFADTIIESLSGAEHFHPAQIIDKLDPALYGQTLDNVDQDLSKLAQSVNDLLTSDIDVAPPVETASKFTTISQEIQNIQSLLADATSLEAVGKSSPKWESFINESGASERDGAASLSDRLSSLIQEADKAYEQLQEKVLPKFEQPEVIGQAVPEAAENLDLTFYYRGLWHPNSGKVNTYRISADVILENSEWAIDDLVDDIDPYVVGQIDVLVLRRALVDLHEAVEDGRINAVAVPVHFTTLNTASTRKKYVEICQTIPPQYQKLIIWEIIGSHVGNWVSQMQTPITTLKPYGRLISLEVDFDHRNFSDLNPMGIDVIGFRFSNVGLGEKKIQSKIDAFCRIAHQNDMKVFIANLPTSSLTLGALRSGTDFLSGDIMMDRSNKPLGVQGLDFGIFYRRYANQRGLQLAN